MHQFIQFKNATSLIVIALMSLCPALLPKSQAVSPAPDGGYPGRNTAEGIYALLNLTSGTDNTAVGYVALANNRTGSFNTAIGAGALVVDAANENTATGAQALVNNTTGTANTAVGAFAIPNNTTGNGNTANGDRVLLSNTTGTGNTASGVHALLNNTTGNRNIALGAGAGASVTTASDVICIGAGGENTNNACYIGQVFGTLSSGGTAVFINSNGKLGTIQSSQRFKEDIKPMAQASETIFALEPVTFHYKKAFDPTGTAQFGLVAEDVEKVNPKLVVRDKEGKPYTVRYDAVNAMLLNEFLKEHKAFVEAQHKVEKLETTVASLVATVKEQTAKIQKVSAQLEVSKPAPQTVLNSR